MKQYHKQCRELSNVIVFNICQPSNGWEGVLDGTKSPKMCVQVPESNHLSFVGLQQKRVIFACKYVITQYLPYIIKIPLTIALYHVLLMHVLRVSLMSITSQLQRCCRHVNPFDNYLEISFQEERMQSKHIR